MNTIAPAITYQLLIRVSTEVDLSVGRLGNCHFPAGRYIYTGSARRHLEARLTRHLSWQEGARHPLHWHIDYLLAAPGVAVVGVRRYAEGECDIQQRTPGECRVAGFGAADCRAGCGSHLKYLGK
jgi:Uri superfamily endonuclease